MNASDHSHKTMTRYEARIVSIYQRGKRSYILRDGMGLSGTASFLVSLTAQLFSLYPPYITNLLWVLGSTLVGVVIGGLGTWFGWQRVVLDYYTITNHYARITTDSNRGNEDIG